MANLTSQQKWQLFLDEVERRKDMEARLVKLEKMSEMRIRNKQCGGQGEIYDPNKPEPPRPPISEMTGYKSKGEDNA